jgi:hypothetical protein
MIGVRSAAVSVLVVLGLVLAPTSAEAAVSVTRASLSASRTLTVEGRGAVARSAITVTSLQSTARGTADGNGRFAFTASGFTASDCRAKVADPSTSVTVTLSGCTPSTSAAPAAPTLLAPANGAGVTTPFTIDWTQEFDPSLSPNGGYNWQVSTTSSFTTFALRDSTLPTVTEATVSGLAAGTYFWRVQAVDGQLRSSPFSAARSFTVTGATTSQPGTPVLRLPTYGSSFHPFESFELFWTAADRAATYELLASKDSTFPAASIKFDNITGTSRGLTIGDFCGGCEQGTYFARVVAIDGAGNRGVPSNTVTFTISYSAPLPPPPTAVSPAAGATVTLPVTLDWSDVPNPQDLGYEIFVAKDAGFTDVELQGRTTASQTQVLSLTSGTKFWRVYAVQGNDAPDSPAITAPSATRSFTVASAGAAVQSVWLGAPPCTDPCPGADTLVSGQEINGSIQLATAAPAGGAVVTLSSNPGSGASHPASVTVPAGSAFAGFTLVAGQVAQTTPVTLTATLGSSSDTFAFTVRPTTVKLLSFCCDSTGGLPAGAHLSLTGQVPSGGMVVALSSDSPLAQPPATVTVPAGSFSIPVAIPTSEVTATTTVTISATHNGTTVSAPLRLYPQVPPSAVVLDRSSTTGTQGASGTVRIAEAAGRDVHVRLTSSHPQIAAVPPYAQIGAFGVAGSFSIATQAPAVPTDVTISAVGAGVTLTTVLRVDPVASPSLATLTLTATGRSGERVTSSPAGLSVAVGQTGSASFPAGTAVTLTASNGRSAAWSGACSSGGTRTRSCTFTITGPASVAANVS